MSDPKGKSVIHVDEKESRMVDDWTISSMVHRRIGYWIGQTWFFDHEPNGEGHIPDLALVSIGHNRPTGETITQKD